MKLVGGRWFRSRKKGQKNELGMEGCRRLDGLGWMEGLRLGDGGPDRGVLVDECAVRENGTAHEA
jgi:hypothetical protein